jgi:hypothetical protein
LLNINYESRGAASIEVNEMNFDVCGPFILKRNGSKNLIDNKTKDCLLTDVKNYDNGLENACGCYVFAIHAGKGYTPHYVGRAEKHSILKECLNSANMMKYNGVYNKDKFDISKAVKKGSPTIFFLPMKTPGGKYRKIATNALEPLRFLERWLIAECLRKNPYLLNNKETKYLRSIHVKGIMNSKPGEADTASSKLKMTIW